MSVENGRIDFRLAKSVITMQMLLDRYSITHLKKNKDERVGECPICKAQGKRAFKVNVARNVFRCFSCDAQGDIIAFVKAMEGCASLADAGKKLRELFPQEIAGVENSSVEQPQPAPQSPLPKSGGRLCFLVIPANNEEPSNERAQSLLNALPWIARVSVGVQNGTDVVEVMGINRQSES